MSGESVIGRRNLAVSAKTCQCGIWRGTVRVKAQGEMDVEVLLIAKVVHGVLKRC